MTKDVNEIVLDAFRVEHREQLEQIRTLLGSLQPGASVADDPRLRDAFRMAHSFKGGARVCDLREVEQLGHGLETVLEGLSHGDLHFNKDVLSMVTLVLDSIEDWMAAFDQEQPPPDISDALTAMEHVLADVSVSARSTQVPAKKTTQLLPVFCQEHQQHSARLRRLLAHWSSSGDGPDDEELTEAARVAHTLARAAAVVEMRAIETVAERMEQLFRAVRANQQQLDAAAQRQIEEWLDSMAETMQSAVSRPDAVQQNIAESRVRPHVVEPLPADECNAGAAIVPDARNPAEQSTATSYETVRVSVESLDRLMRSSSEMLADNQLVARLMRQLAALQLEVNDLERERESVRRAALSSLHKLAATPEFGRVSRYLEYVDRQVGGLAKRTRQLSVDGRHVAWQLRTRSTQVQRDVYEARLVPAHSVFQGFRKMVRDLAKSQDKEIEFQAVGMDVRADRMVLQELKDPIMHVLRNCVSHGIEHLQQRRDAGKPESGRVSIRLEVAGGRLNVVVEDDGRGIDVHQIQQQAVRRGLLTEADAAHQSAEETLSLVFEPGLSTAEAVTELAGRGIGLSVVHDSVARLQGQVTLSPKPEGGIRVSLSVPVFVSTHRVLLIACGNQTIAIPTHGIERLLRIPKDKIETLEGEPVVTHERRPIRLARLADILAQPESPSGDDHDKMMPVVLLKSGTRLLAVSVDTLLEERDALILNLDEFAESRQLAGGILLDDGKVALVVQPIALMENAQRSRTPRPQAPTALVDQAGPAKVLIVDDSFTTRTLEKNILEAQGFEVSVAIDGVEALSLLRQQKFALVIADVEMPRLDGFALLEQMKADRRLARTPVILVTSRDRQEDQQHGLDLGADAYIVKRKFDHQDLLSTIRQLL
jgi:two-component system chemotaxis sensor kinase CheA